MCSAPGDLPGDLWCRCLFAFIINECDCCFRQICRCHFGLLFARRFATCVAVQRLRVRLLGRLLSFVYFWYFQFVTYKSLSGCAMLRSQIPISERTSSFGIKHVLAVNTIRILKLYLHVFVFIYVYRYVLAVALASLP